MRASKKLMRVCINVWKMTLELVKSHCLW